jgi:ABC-type transport system involved in cytochrome c biogenesis permease subunit
MRVLVNTMHIVIAALFVLHTLRWELVGLYLVMHHGVMRMKRSFMSRATMFFGLAFDIKSKLTVASAAFVSAIILSAAYMNWIDPEIANLQPVLNSYWLMIHVAVIVASYGPFALGMILGFVSLLLILLPMKNKAKMDLNIMEITYINELALTVGLILLLLVIS